MGDMGTAYRPQLVLVVVLTFIGCASRQLSAVMPQPNGPLAAANSQFTPVAREQHASVCPGPSARGAVRCHALVRTDIAPIPDARIQSPWGYACRCF